MEKLFKLSERGTNVRTEAVAGITTFLTMAYIIFVNPDILSAGGVPKAGAITATCLASGVVTLLMGLYANWPLALASGMGLNAFVAFNLVGGLGLSWQAAMGIVFLEGAAILVLVLIGMREAVFNAIPTDLRRAIASGIGLFIAFIGLKNAGIVVQSQATLVTFGAFKSAEVLLAVFGLIVTLALLERKTPGAMLIGIAATTAAAAALGKIQFHGLVDVPSFETIGRIDLKGALSLGFTSFTLIFSFMMVDFFDTLGTVTGIGQQAGLSKGDEEPPQLRRVLIVDSLGALGGGLCGASSVTSYIESASGVSAGGRTGLASVVTGALFLAAMFFAPAIGIVPAYATAPALILTGFFMMSPLREIDFDDRLMGASAFLILIVMPLTFSIAHGIGYGFIFYTIGALLTGRAARVKPLMYVVSLFFLLNIVFENIKL